MRTLLARLRAEIDHTRRVYRIHHRIVAEQDAYWDADAALVNQALSAERIADWAARQADHLEASWLARTLPGLPTPVYLRDTAEMWQQRAVCRWIEAGSAK